MSFDLAQLHVSLDDSAFHDVALAYARLSQFGDHRMNAAMSNAINLRGRIVEHLWKDNAPPKGKRRGETDIADLVYQRTVSSSFREASNAGEGIIQQTEFKIILREKLIMLLQTFASSKRLLTSNEWENVERLREVLGHEITPLIEISAEPDPVERRAKFERFITRATDMLGYFERGGLFANLICLPPMQHARDLATREAGFAESLYSCTSRSHQTHEKTLPIGSGGRDYSSTSRNR